MARLLGTRAVVWLAVTWGACASNDDGGAPRNPRGGLPGADATVVSNDAGGSIADAASYIVQLDAEPPKVCADIETTPERSVPSVTFLIDGSGSMHCAYPEDEACPCDKPERKSCAPQSRWEALSFTLFGDGVTQGLVAGLQDAVRFGLWVYHGPRGGLVCPAFPAQSAPALSQLDTLKAALPTLPPGDNTPTAPALAQLVDALPNAQEAEAQKLGPQKIILATDGEPYTCQNPSSLKVELDFQSVIDATRAANDKSIDVYVLSLAPVAGNFAAHLDDVAKTGGTTSAYAPANQSELSAALTEIIASAISCTIRLNGAIQQPEVCVGSANLDGEELQCGDPNGFAIRDESHVELLGEACRRFKYEPGIALKMNFPCGSFELQ